MVQQISNILMETTRSTFKTEAEPSCCLLCRGKLAGWLLLLDLIRIILNEAKHIQSLPLSGFADVCIEPCSQRPVAVHSVMAIGY